MYSYFPLIYFFFTFFYVSVSLYKTRKYLFISFLHTLGLFFFHFFYMLIYLPNGRYPTRFLLLNFVLVQITAGEPMCHCLSPSSSENVILWHSALAHSCYRTCYFHFSGWVFLLCDCVFNRKITIVPESSSHTRHENYITRI